MPLPPICRRSLPVLLLLLLIVAPLTAVKSQVSASIHTPFGNISNAGSDPNNLLVTRAQFAASWNAGKRTANWVAWRLRASDIGSSGRSSFHTDAEIDTPKPSDYTNSGYDRGHLCPSGDRSNSTANNYAVFSMLNIIPQSPDNNQGPWEKLESYSRSLAESGREIYVIAGPVGSRATFHDITAPISTWKIVVALETGKTYPDGVTDSTTIAVTMPNENGIRYDGWQKYQTSVGAIAAETGYNFSGYPNEKP